MKNAARGVIAIKIKSIVARVAVLTLLCSVFGGCATKSELAPHYEAVFPGLSQKRVKPSHVRILEAPLSKSGLEAFGKNLSKEGYEIIGLVKCSGRLISDEELRNFAGSVGGDLVAKGVEFAGMQTDSRYVVGSYTSGRVVTSTSNVAGTALSNSSGTISGSRGPGYWNSNNAQNLYASGSAMTFIPGETTYVRENFQYPAYHQIYVIYQSDPVFRQNANNLRRFMREVQDVDMSDAQFAAFIARSSPAKSGTTREKEQ